MPITYRQRTPSMSFDPASSPRSHSVPVPTDADDSIVLSDLVRQGEASRLRRRGAMRLDHAPMGLQPTPTRDLIEVPPSIAVGAAPWESESDPTEEGSLAARNTIMERDRGYRSAYGYGRSRARGEPCEDNDDYGYTLFCGSENADAEMELDLQCHESNAFQPSILPLYPPSLSLPSPSSSRRSRSRRIINNGCGALLHMHASPRRRQGVWQAKNEASSGALVGLDAAYFDRAAVAKIVRSACGCVREGVGCAVCGNPLGTRYKPCKTAADGIFSSLSRAVPSPPLHPEGPRYWHAQSRSTRPYPSASSNEQSELDIEPTSPFYVYTFFSAHVSSSPRFTFPPRPTAAFPPFVADPQQPQPQLVRTPFQPPYPQRFNTYQPLQLSVESPTTAISPSPRPQATPASIVPVPATSDDGERTMLADVPVDIVPERLDSPIFANPALPPPLTSFFDRGLTSSPSPLPDSEDTSEAREIQDPPSGIISPYSYQYREVDAYPYSYQPLDSGRTELFDPDGEFITEPESPDKTAEVMLFPER